MTIKTFISQYRTELDSAINSVIYRYDGNGGKGKIPIPAPTYNDRERHEWIMNDENLYKWAKSEGCKI